MSKVASRRLKSVLLNATALVCISAMAAPVLAQGGNKPSSDKGKDNAPVTDSSAPAGSSPGDGAAPASGDEKVTVTGTRIRRPGLKSNSPITSVGQIEIKQQSAQTVETVLRSQPQFVPIDNAAINNGSAGQAVVDLRALGPQRTLVLMDGKRIIPGGLSGLVDLNIVPLALIERIDVVTGGASAVYGSDALAGVVNFILKKNFEGYEVNATYGQATRGFGETWNVEGTAGANFDNDRGNVTLTVGYSKRNPVRQDKRAFGVEAFTSQGGYAFGSYTAVPSIIFTNGGAGAYQFTDAGGLTPALQTFNFNPVNYFQTPQKRWQAAATARHEITPEVEVYGRVLYAAPEVTTQLAPSGTFFQGFDIPEDNPFLTAGTRAFLCADNGLACNPGDVIPQLPIGRRTVEVGPRVSSFDTDSFQILGGFKGSIFGDWAWDISYSYGETNLATQFLNDINSQRVQQALRASDPAVCDDPSNGCVPLNLFGGLGSITPEMADFIRLNLSSETENTEQQFIGTLSGDLDFLVSPYAVTPVAMAFGAEYRKAEGDFRPDANLATPGLPIGFGAAQPVSGEFDVWEVFTEANIPLVENVPFIRALTVDLGYRYSDYDPQGDTRTYKVGGTWTLIDGLRFRGMFQRAVRAPNIGELFTPINQAVGNLTVDPCAGAIADAGLAALCVATGAPAARVAVGTVPGPIAGQINIFTGGNPTLAPESSNTITLGAVMQPEFIPGLSITIDYFRVAIANAVGTFSENDIIDGCYDPAQNPGFDPGAALCSPALILRNPNTGGLVGDPAFGLVLTNQNVSIIKVRGIDLGIDYRFDVEDIGGEPDWGTITLAFFGTHMMDQDFKATAISPLARCAGRYGTTCDPSSPEYRFVQRTTWTMDPWEVSLRWRHYSELTLDAFTTALPEYSRIDSFNYLDLYASYKVTEKVTVSIGIDNITDEDPPFVGNTIGDTAYNSGNTYPATYDALGPFLSIGVNVRY